MGSMTDSTSTRRPSIDAVQFGHLVEAEERRFKECLERVVRNGVDDKAGTAELAASPRATQLPKRSLMRLLS